MNGRRTALSILLLMVLVQAIGCNRLFWRERSDFHSAHWLGPDRLIEVRQLYAEKMPWDLLAGTTLKKDLRTRLYEIRLQGQTGLEVLAVSADLPGQPEGSVYPFRGEILLLQRTTTETGTTLDVYAWERSGNRFVSRMSSPVAGYYLRSFMVSPDQKKLLLVLESDRGRQALLWLEEWSQAEKPALSVIVSGLIDIAWDRSNERVFLHLGGQILQWDGKKAPQTALNFPSCFRPPTAVGGAISEEGLSYMREEESGKPEIVSVPGWKAYARIPYTTDLAAVGKDCP